MSDLNNTAPTVDLSVQDASSNNAVTKEAKIEPGRYKTKLCRHFMETGVCPFLSRCVFAHGHNEMRTAEQNETDGITTGVALKEQQHRAAMQAAVAASMAPLPTLPAVPRVPLVAQCPCPDCCGSAASSAPSTPGLKQVLPAAMTFGGAALMSSPPVPSYCSCPDCVPAQSSLVVASAGAEYNRYMYNPYAESWYSYVRSETNSPAPESPQYPACPVAVL